MEWRSSPVYTHAGSPRIRFSPVSSGSLLKLFTEPASLFLSGGQCGQLDGGYVCLIPVSVSTSDYLFSLLPGPPAPTPSKMCQSVGEPALCV